jgi:hypothetical protein
MLSTVGDLSTLPVFHEKLPQLFYHTPMRKRINPLKRMKRLKMTGGCVQILLKRGLIITYSIAGIQPLVERLLGG